MLRIFVIIVLTIAAATLVIGQASSKKEEAVKTQVEITTASGAHQGWIVEEPIVITEHKEYGLYVYPATTVAIKSISGGSIRFRNPFPGNFVIEKSVSAEEATEMLKAIEKAGTSEERLNAVLQTYRSKSLRYEEFFVSVSIPSMRETMMESFRNNTLDKNWRMMKPSPVKLADQQGKVTASIESKDIVGFKVLEK